MTFVSFGNMNSAVPCGAARAEKQTTYLALVGANNTMQSPYLEKKKE